MLLNRIILENVGPFFGRHEIDLAPSGNRHGDKPIVIFGGKNGSGKSTIFEAITLCLYGQSRFEKSNGSYRQYLRRLIHGTSVTEVPPNYAAITLEFDYSLAGQVNNYTVTRTWESTGRQVVESVAVKENDLPLKDIDQQFWPDFVRNLIPAGLTQLFFFDGEKIQRIMRESDSGELRNSMRQMIGLDLVNRLESDLSVVRRRVIKAGADRDLEKQLVVLEDTWNKVTDTLNKLKAELAAIRARLEEKKEEIARYEKKIAANNGHYAAEQSNLEAMRRTAEVDIEQARDNMRAIIGGLYPLCLVPELARKTREKVQLEVHQADWRAAQRIVKRRIGRVFSNLGSTDYWANLGVDMNNIQAASIQKDLKHRFEDALNPPKGLASQDELLGLSQRQTENLLMMFDVALKDVPDKVESCYAELSRAQNAYDQATFSLSQAPDDELVRPMFERLLELNEQRAVLERKVAQLEMSISTQEAEQADVERTLESVKTKQLRTTRERTKLTLVNNSAAVLERFKSELAKRKLGLLEDEFTSIFNRLNRKGDLVHKVTVDPENLDIALFERKGREISQSSLSAGEAEIYSIAMLWALARISGKRLPFVIDTPLGRLDSSHRDRLVREFFPLASHQTIIFSTDTEVDKSYFDELRPHISRAYQISYIGSERRSVVTPGYFWEM